MSNALAELKTAVVINTLRSCQLFTGLSAEELWPIADITVAKRLAKDEYLFRQGDPARGFFIVQTGAVNVHRVNSAGKEQIIHVFRPGESLAEAALASETGYPADGRALEGTQVLLIHKEGFLALLRRKPELAIRMLGAMSSHLRVLVGRLEDLTLKDVETRFANWLIKHCPERASEKPVRIELTMTKRVLAAELGTVSETFSRLLAKFRADKLLVVKGKTLTVLSPARLDAVLRRNVGGSPSLP